MKLSTGKLVGVLGLLFYGVAALAAPLSIQAGTYKGNSQIDKGIFTDEGFSLFRWPNGSLFLSGKLTYGYSGGVDMGTYGYAAWLHYINIDSLELTSTAVEPHHFKGAGAFSSNADSCSYDIQVDLYSYAQNEIYLAVKAPGTLYSSNCGEALTYSWRRSDVAFVLVK